MTKAELEGAKEYLESFIKCRKLYDFADDDIEALTTALACITKEIEQDKTLTYYALEEDIDRLKAELTACRENVISTIEKIRIDWKKKHPSMPGVNSLVDEIIATLKEREKE